MPADPSWQRGRSPGLTGLDVTLQRLRPMQAVAALYTRDDHGLAPALIASLSRCVFEGRPTGPAGPMKRTLAGVTHHVLKWTTRRRHETHETGPCTTRFRNRLLEGSGHPYAAALMNSSCAGTASLVEGGDPMNGPYMMLIPELRRNGSVWDKLFLDSVQGRDLQSRLVWETRAAYQEAKSRLALGHPVRLKAVAAGTGLSLILVYDKLISDGFSPDLITARIADRDSAGIDKASHLLDALAKSMGGPSGAAWRRGISAVTEDVLDREGTTPSPGPDHWDIVTAIGILEYFSGCSHATSEQRLGLDPATGSVTAHDLARRLADMTAEGGKLIVNTYKDDASTRIVELFGRRFAYRRLEDLNSLLAPAGFRPVQLVGSGNIYDVQVYEKAGPGSPGSLA